ncbi:MAG: ISLre2 family transposase, partial [bacterium]
ELALQQASRRRRGGERERVLRLWGYLREHWEGIVGWGEAPRLGAAEATVFHVVARRMKRHGARWSGRGADRLARLLSARANGEELAVGGPMAVTPELRRAVRGMVRRLVRAGEGDPAAWLRAHLPVLSGPHADRHWAQILRELSHVQAPVA